MQMSPGTQVVWSLAARETKLAQAQNVTPEHFFCALLKFTELEASDLAGLAQMLSVDMGVELGRDQKMVVDALAPLELNTVRVRHDIRRECGKGQGSSPEENLHRSPESRELFERASLVAIREKEPLRPVHLLREIFNQPGVVLQKCLRIAPDEDQQDENDGLIALEEAPQSAADSRWIDLGQQAINGNFNLADAYAPPVKVLAWAMDRDTPAHLLLWCAPQLPLEALLAAAYMESEKIQTMRAIELQQSEITSGAQLREMLASQPENPEMLLVINAAGFSADTIKTLAAEISGVFEKPVPRLAWAVAEALHGQDEMRAFFAPYCRAIWLHNLSAQPDWMIV